MCNLDSNSKETLETETLGSLAVKIARYATEADEKTLEAAKLVGEARKRVEAGEAGATVGATTGLEDDRKSLIEWARSAPIERLAEVLSYTRRLDSAETVSNSGQSAVSSAT